MSRARNESAPQVGGGALRVLNLGAGVQSTTLFLMAHEGTLDIDHAVFADTQEEPEAVYQHLAWLRTVPAPVPVLHVATKGKLGDHLLEGINSTGGRFASIPCFTAKHHTLRQQREACNEGIVQRQCTKEYKVEVVERVIRRDILGLKPRQRIPKGTAIQQLFGISADEKGRAKRITVRFAEDKPWAMPVFPLIEMGMTREDCKAWLKGRVPHETPRSACVFCPYKSAEEWLRTKSQPAEWARAVAIDNAIREPGRVVNRNMDLSLYLHRQCIPLEMVDLESQAEKEREKKRRPLWDVLDCGEGMCGV